MKVKEIISMLHFCDRHLHFTLDLSNCSFPSVNVKFHKGGNYTGGVQCLNPMVYTSSGYILGTHNIFFKQMNKRRVNDKNTI